MTETQKFLQCPECGKRIKFSPTQDRGACPQCSTVLIRTSNGVSALNGKVPAAPPHPSFNIPSVTLTPPSPASEELSLPAYLWRHWAATHGNWFLPTFLAVLAVPVLSLLKPTIGSNGVACVAVSGIVLGAGCFLIYLVRQTGAYLWGGSRVVTPESSSKLACFAYASFALALFALIPLAVIEHFTPPSGLLAAAVSPLRELQEDLGITSHSSAEVEAIEQPDQADVPAASVVKVEQDDAADAERPLQSVATEDTQSPHSKEAQLAQQPAPDTASRKTARQVSSEDDEPSVSEAELDTSNVLEQALSSGNLPPATVSDDALQAVVVEGVGITADEALKDAFRNAVRQVVGAVVDAETLIRNDELIDDNVLTYSDGFIKKFEEIKGSKTAQGGLHRITIKANVERRSVVAKLKAANVAVKEVDGGGLFAEIVTELDAQNNAAAMVEKTLKDFPLNCMKVDVVGKPEVVEKSDEKATIRVLLKYSADIAAYDAFAQRLHDTLKHVAKESGEFSMIASLQDTPTYNNDPAWKRNRERNPIFREPYRNGAIGKHVPVMSQESSPFVLVVNTLRTKSFDRTGWTYYVLDETARPPLAALSACAFTVKMSLLDADNQPVAFDTFLAIDTSYDPVVDHFTFVASNDTGGQSHGNATSLLLNDERPFSEAAYSALLGNAVKGYPPNHMKMTLAIISPFVVTNVGSMHDFKCAIEYVAEYTCERDLTLSLEELRSVTSIKAELSFNGGTLPPKVNPKR